MSLNEEFDELARRKLEERQFAFQEADWQDARARIDAHRGGRGRAAWLIGAGLLLLISSMAWYGTRSLMNAPNIAAVEKGKIDRSQHVSLVSASAAMSTPSQRNSRVAAPIVEATETSLSTVQTANNAVNVEASTSVVERTEAETRVKRVAISAATASNVPMVAPSRAAEALVPAPTRRQEPVPSNAAHSNVSNNSDQPALSVSQGHQPSGEVIGNDAHQGEGSIQLSTEIPSDQQTALSEARFDVKVDPLQVDTGIPIGPGITLDTTLADEQDLVLSGEVIQVVQDLTGESAKVVTGSDQPTALDTNASTDSASAPTSAVPNETINAAPPAPEAAPPLVPVSSPWEISVLGGSFTSKTDYSGSNSAEWTGDISSEHSISVGAEFVHMGRNIGIGAGLHYGSYAERLRSNAIDMTSTSTANYWYLLPVHTTFLFITDTLPGQPPTYTGTSVDTTVNVLTQGTNTLTSTERLREAREQMNRVNYLEVPLLIDAHLVQGRWSFGVRGGPTLGLLTGRRGSVPSADNEGYVEFADMPFREFILGYTTRVYVRYRFNAAWSVGIEPAIRGQLMNSLGSGDLARHASSKGVLLSLSYRLR